MTTDTNKYVTIFGSDGRFESKFAAVSPSGVPSDHETSLLRGIVANNGIIERIIVGEITNKYISIHDANGMHRYSIPISVAPNYLAITRRTGHIIVSPNAENQDVQILDISGLLLHTINAPRDVSKWYPVGVCCSSRDDIFVFNRGSPIGIYRFSSSGNYLGCINQTSDYAYMRGGLTFSHDEEKLLVADGGHNVYIFGRK